jgi:hypothetical protein
MDSSDVFRGTNIERRNWIILARPEASCRHDDNECLRFLATGHFVHRLIYFNCSGGPYNKVYSSR